MEKIDNEIFERCLQSVIALEKSSIYVMRQLTQLLAIRCKNNNAAEIGADIYTAMHIANEWQKYINKKIILLSRCASSANDLLFDFTCMGEERSFISNIETLNNLFHNYTALDPMSAFVQFEWEIGQLLHQMRNELLKQVMYHNHLHQIWRNISIEKMYWYDE